MLKSESKRRLLLSSLFVVESIFSYGFSCFFIDWRVYLEHIGYFQNKLTMVGTLMVSALGIIISNFIILVLWPKRSFQLVNPLVVLWSILTGLLQCVGVYYFIISAKMHIPATISGPVSGLSVLVPPLWYCVYNQKVLGARTAMGFVLSIATLVLFSGLISESVSYTMSRNDFSTLSLIVIPFGIALILQAEASKGCTFTQFPQVDTFRTIGGVMGYVIFACFEDASDIIERSTWLPFNFAKLLVLLSTVFMSLGSGFFCVSLLYTENTNRMVAIMSLYITLPAILGIVILEEPATWTHILGFLSALLAAITMAFEVKEGSDIPKANER